MNRHAAQARLPAYLAGHLTPAETAAVDQHLRDCATCRADLASLAETEGRLRSAFHAQRLALPAGAWARLGAATAGRRPAASRRPALAAIAAALIAAVIFISPVSAQLGGWVSRWLHISVPNTTTQVDVSGFTAFTPFVPSFLPAGFDLTATGIHESPEGPSFQLVYDHGRERIAIIQRLARSGDTAPPGMAVALDHAAGLLIEDTAEMDAEALELFKPDAPRLLVWTRAGVQIKLYAKLDTAELARVANSMVPAER